MLLRCKHTQTTANCLLKLTAACLRKTRDLFYATGEVLKDSDDILHHLHEAASGGLGVTEAAAAAGPPRTLFYPPDPQQRQQVLDLECRFNTVLGRATRLVAYHYAVFVRASTTLDVLALKQPDMEWWKCAVFTLGFLPIRALMKLGMNINAASAEAALSRVVAVFAEVDALLADGRQYLVGGRLTAADITFACMAAPALLPSGYGAWTPRLEDTPPDFPGRRLAQTAAGRFALSIYERHRHVQ